MLWALKHNTKLDEWVSWHLGLQVLLKYTHQMCSIGYLNPNDWKSNWTNKDECYFTRSRDLDACKQCNQAVHAWTQLFDSTICFNSNNENNRDNQSECFTWITVVLGCWLDCKLWAWLTVSLKVISGFLVSILECSFVSLLSTRPALAHLVDCCWMNLWKHTSSFFIHVIL